jgi:hypothetical protein
MDDSIVCARCERVWPSDRYNSDCTTPDWCFACRSKTIRTAFQGGKQYFHDGTEAERSRKAVSEARAAGFDPVPAETGKGWNGASAASIKKLEKVSTSKVGS